MISQPAAPLSSVPTISISGAISASLRRLREHGVQQPFLPRRQLLPVLEHLVEHHPSTVVLKRIGTHCAGSATGPYGFSWQCRDVVRLPAAGSACHHCSPSSRLMNFMMFSPQCLHLIAVRSNPDSAPSSPPRCPSRGGCRSSTPYAHHAGVHPSSSQSAPHRRGPPDSAGCSRSRCCGPAPIGRSAAATPRRASRCHATAARSS